MKRFCHFAILLIISMSAIITKGVIAQTQSLHIKQIPDEKGITNAQKSIQNNMLIETARKITIVVTRPSNVDANDKSFSGSGVIIARSNKTYYVLTTKHPLNRSKHKYTIETSDRQSHQVDDHDVDLFSRNLNSDVDLALLTFTSDTNYTPTCIGDLRKMSPSTTVYLSGWIKLDWIKKEGKPKFIDGQIIQHRGMTDNYEGYNLIYSNEANNGMSGGPLLNANGCIVGIHGRRQALRWENRKGYIGIGIDAFKRALLIATGETINGHQTRNGSLNSSDGDNPTRSKRYYDDYVLTGVRSGKQVTVEMNSSNFDTYLQLIDASTGKVIQSDDDGGSDNNSRLNFTVESGRDYLIRATSYGSGVSGSYTITATGETISGNQTRSGNLSSSNGYNPTRNKKYYYDYLLTGVSSGEQVTIKMNSSNIDDYLQLIDANTGRVIQSDDDGGSSGNNSRLNFTVESGRNYLIRATSFGDGDSGSYTLTTSSDGGN